MSGPVVASRSKLTAAESIEELAPALALAHQPLTRAHARGPLVDLDAVSRSIERAASGFRTPRPNDPAYQKAAEWVLDNHYLIARTIRQVKSELPGHFRRRLPHVGADEQPRVLRIARAVIETTALDFDEATLLQFADVYQSRAPLAIAELWALPTTLRICVLEALVDVLAAFFAPAGGLSARAGLPGEPALLVGRAVRALRQLAEIDWRIFFQRTSAVDATLRADPAGVYATMDFETRDHYRKGVEELAWQSKRSEVEVARLAVALASEHTADVRQGHVGFYLVDRGRARLEGEIGYRAPAGERLRRALLEYPTLAYLGPIGALTLLMLTALGVWGLPALGGLGAGALCILAAVPVSSIAVAFTNWAVTKLLRPRTLPKLDFSEGIPQNCRTAVVIPALVESPNDVDRLLAQLELHALSNSDPSLVFVLLTDHADTLELPDDGPLLAHAERALDALNEKHGSAGRGPFHLLHRAAIWNEAEGVFMGWERKRGKLEEFNRLLRGARATSFQRRLGDPAGLRDIRFVITLDADTQLPLGAAEKLVGLLAHPLNQVELDARTGRVVSGYTVVQPRIEAAPVRQVTSWFNRVFSGDTALDIYTRAVSDVYQDLFGSGVYVGKGIYDVDAFMRSLEGRVPENALASHDLFEGIHGRAALATDIVLFEEYPQHYLAFARRMHRWIRGDWQLLPWLLPGSARGLDGRSSLSLIDRWKVADNLRRSLLSPALFSLILFGWFSLPQHAIAWTLTALAVPLIVSLPGLLGERWRESLGRWGFSVALLPYEAWLAADAILRVLVRLIFTHRHLLEWITAASTSRLLSRHTARRVLWGEMGWALVLTLALLTSVALFQPALLLPTLPLLTLWLLAPELARWASFPRVRHSELSSAEQRTLRLLARRTWLFFETFVGPGDQWLPPDNFQQEPLGRIAHRTSPTNIGLMLVAQLSARDLGYIGPCELSALLHHSLDSVERLERYRGHWLNWYDTKTREPLLPRYVSTVDSGNLAAAFIALAQGCRDQADAPVFDAKRWEGVVDALDLLEQTLTGLPPAHQPPSDLLAAVRGSLDRAERSWDSVLALSRSDVSSLDRALLEALEGTVAPHDVALFREARTWLDRLHHQLRGLRADIEAFFPWMVLLDEARGMGIEFDVDVAETSTLSLSNAAANCARFRDALLTQAREHTTAADARWFEHARVVLAEAELRANALCQEFEGLAARAEAAWLAMDFAFLFDAKRKLFHIGYNVEPDQLDSNYYDLLASEARLASFIAVIRKQVPPAHWIVLGRPITRIRGSVALLSWGGTLFEYLLPTIFMRSSPNTLLAQSTELAVVAQRDYARRTDTPWGISESGFAELDAQQNYQYRSFGVPALGLRRGLEDDLVIAPYACMLGLPLDPQAVLKNLPRLEHLGALGTYGLFEAIDFHPTRAEEALRGPGRASRTFSVVRSHMAHHQGMVLAALNNALNRNVLVERFHESPQVKTGELLLSERLPSLQLAETVERPEVDGVEPAPAPADHFPLWQPERSTTTPGVALLTNGRLTTLVTDTGAGWVRYKGNAVTRGVPDATCDVDGLWIYIRDEESGQVWSVTPAPTRPRAASDYVAFHAHKVEFHHREQGISVRTEIAVAPLEDVEIRHVTLHNETQSPRTLSLASYAEPVLEPFASAARHPAFSRLFLECEAIPEQHAVLASRRMRSPNEPTLVVVHRAVWDSSRVSWLGCEMDREAFIGRRRDARSPRIMAEPRAPRGDVKGAIDPVMALALEVTLDASATVEIAFVTAVARTRPAALTLGRHFGSLHAGRWAMRDAERASARRLKRTGVAPNLFVEAMWLASRLLVPGPALRASRETLTMSGPSQRQLWVHGISGDDPLLVVRVEGKEESPLVEEVLAVHRYLRACKVPLELVFLDMSASGYLGNDGGNVRQVLLRTGSNAWLQQRGGIFVLAADQLAPDQRRQIEAAARVLLDDVHGPLSAQLSRLPTPPPPLPLFSGILPGSATPARTPRVPKLSLHNGYGGFTEDGRQYVIDSKAGRSTPAPWCNVLANPDFGCLVSESSLGSTWSQNSGEHRLTPWSNDPVCDTPSEVLYLRDEETGEVWSTTPLPAGLDADTLVQHGAGYTMYARDSHGLAQELTVFVCSDAPVKVLQLSLTNHLTRSRRLTATYYVEWLLGAMRGELQAQVLSEFDSSAQCIFARSAWNADFSGQVAFVSVDRAVHGFTCDRSEFLGRSGSLRDPEALRRWGLAGSSEPGTDPCAALQVHLELGPGETLKLHFVLGEGQSKQHAGDLVQRFRSPTEVQAAWHGLQAHWDQVLSAVQVKTPEPAMDALLNRWLLYQSLSSRIFARSAFYQSSGAFGFRDQLQDVMAFIPLLPELVRAHILRAAAHQFEEGDVLHWWHPPLGRGVRTRCSDDLLWLPFVVAHYVAASGDSAILEEKVPFLSAPPLRPDEHDRYGEFAVTTETASLLEHCRRALERGFSEGAHGLPLIGDGDWNDGMNRVGAQGRGESVWLAWFLSATATAFATLLERGEQRQEAERWRRRVSALNARVEQVAWDGAWYLRAFYDDGSPLGSSRSRSCQIDSIAQSWAILSGAGDRERARQALGSADARLLRERERLVLLLDPPFEGARHDPGYIAAYPPGVRENGGQYTHAAAWLGWAHAHLADGAGAAKIFGLLNPLLRTQTKRDVERYRVEPYVLAADIYAVPPFTGRGGWTWYTGAAAWTWRLGVEAILGLYREQGGVRFDPCIPPAWPGFEATLSVGDRKLHVVVDNPHGSGRGIRSLTLDGVALATPVVHLAPGPGSSCEVRILLGEPDTLRKVATETPLTGAG